jgi:hypothetical protein
LEVFRQWPRPRTILNVPWSKRTQGTNSYNETEPGGEAIVKKDIRVLDRWAFFYFTSVGGKRVF